MFACLYVPPQPAMCGAGPPAGAAPGTTSGFRTRSCGANASPHAGHEAVSTALLNIARMVSPRVAACSRHQVVIDVEGLERLVGNPKAIGERLRQTAAERGIAPVHVAVAGSCTAAMLLAAARAGVTIVPPGEEAAALAPLPLRTLAALPLGSCSGLPEPCRRERAAVAASRRTSPEPRTPNPESLAVLSRWGLRTLGELAALPAAGLSERLGQDGIRWQRLARGEDTGPLVPAPGEDPFEASLELEWPIEGLEPLSFVLGRLLDPLCQRLERRDRGAAVLHLRLRLVTRDLHLRSLQLPSPMRDPKVLRTLLLLDLESHPAPAGIDAVAIAIDPTPGRILQESLLARALPAPELISTLVARLQALVGEGRCGSPATVDSYRPGAFGMAPFVVEQRQEGERELAPGARPLAPSLRRFRLPIPARVLIDGNCPISVRTDRPALAGGRVCAAAGPWRTSGQWWETAGMAGAVMEIAAGAAPPPSPLRRVGWNRDEWDVALSDGGLYRIFEDRDTGRWFVEAVVD